MMTTKTMLGVAMLMMIGCSAPGAEDAHDHGEKGHEEKGHEEKGHEEEGEEKGHEEKGHEEEGEENHEEGAVRLDPAATSTRTASRTSVLGPRVASRVSGQTSARN